MNFNQHWILRNIRSPSQPLHTNRPHADCSCSPFSENIPSWDLIRYALFDQPAGGARKRVDRLVEPYLAKQLPGLLKEQQYDLKEINKVFAARWLNDHQVVLGSKCNKLLILDLVSSKMFEIPMLHSHSGKPLPDCPCGIHSIAINPSRTLLATGGANVNDLAVYRLPTFDPVCIGENGHSDWLFDLQWLDDQIVVSGSRDSQVALWRIQDDNSEDVCAKPTVNPLPLQSQNCITDQVEMSPVSERIGSCSSNVAPFSVLAYSHIEPLSIKLCKKADKIRAFAYNAHRQELGMLSLNAYLHLWDATTFSQRRSRKLRHCHENVCLAASKCDRIYAVGSYSYVTLIDERMSREVACIPSQQRGCSVRSVNFVDTLLTVGTGMGGIYFYDRRADRYLEMNCGHTYNLTVGPGWLKHDDAYYESSAEHQNAVYVHQFDESGTRLFAAGGPLAAGLWGNYAGLWQ